MAIAGEVLLPGATRTPYAPGAQPVDTSGLGWALDTYGAPTERNDWVYGPGGRPVISGSSEEYGGPLQAPAGSGPGYTAPPTFIPPAIAPPSGVAPPAGTPVVGGVQPAPPVDAAALNAPPPALSSAQLVSALLAQLGASAPKLRTGADTGYLAVLKKILDQLNGGQQYGGVQGG